MTDKEFKEYVYEQRRQGRSESQIARSLGMSLSHLMGRLNGVDVEKVDPPKTNAQTAKDLGIKEAPVRPVQKPEKPKKEKPVDIPKVEEPKEEKPVEDLSWME